MKGYKRMEEYLHSFLKLVLSAGQPVIGIRMECHPKSVCSCTQMFDPAPTAAAGGAKQ
jgi:hypothetical protein